MSRALKTYEIEGHIVIRELIKSSQFRECGCDIDLMEIPVKTPMEPHHHKTFDEAFYVVAGHGVRTDGDKEYPIQQGDVFLALRGQTHAVFTQESSLSILTICLPHFDETDIYYEGP